MFPAKDKLKKLKEFQDDNKNEAVDIEDEVNSESLQFIFRNVESIRQDFDAMKGNIVRFGDVLSKFQVFPTKELQAQLHSMLTASTTVNNTVLNKIKTFEAGSKKKTLTQNEERIRSIQCSSLRQEYKDLLQQNNDIIESYKDTMKAQIKASAKIVRPNQDEEELEKLLDNDQPIQIFIDNILEDTNAARQQLRDIEERHQELLFTENKLKEIVELFQLIAIHVEQQQESINRVEFNCETTTAYIDDGVVDLSKGIRKKKKLNKCKIYFIIVLSVVVLLFILAILIG